MLKNYFVSYWTLDGQKVGMQISAFNTTDAKVYAENMPNFGSLCDYPQEVGGNY